MPGMDLKCSPCLDARLSGPDGGDAVPVPDAVTIVPLLQSFAVNGQQIVAPVPVPVCTECRRKQLGAVSRSGLVTA